MQKRASILIGVLLLGCNSVTSTHPDAADNPPIDSGGTIDASTTDSASSGFTVGGTISGLVGDQDVEIELNDGAEVLTIGTNGDFVFDTLLDDGAIYSVAVSGQPVCPARVCTVDNSTGMIEGAPVADITIDCADPIYRMATVSWGDNSLRIIDDLFSIGNGGSADPRIVAGGNTEMPGNSNHDGVAMDSSRNLIYVGNSNGVLVFENLDTLSGNVAPVRSFKTADQTNFYGLELDAELDRLYVDTETHLLIFDNASTLDGGVDATAAIPLSDPQTIALDRMTDTLYVGGDLNETIWSFDNASTLTSASTPDRTITWNVSGDAGYNGPQHIAADGCSNRLLIGTNFKLQSGQTLVIFDNANTVDGLVNFASDSAAMLEEDTVCISVFHDVGGRAYCLHDSATAVRIYQGVAGWTGSAAHDPDLIINNIADGSYALEIVPMP